MACQFCQLPTPKTLCEICQYMAETGFLEHALVCQHCRAPLAGPQPGQLDCQLCQVMLVIVQNSPWFHYAHCEWQQENLLLARRKQELLG